MVFSVLGEIRLFAGNFEPTGWAFCDGRLLGVGGNSDLIQLIGYAYGGSGAQFALPNLPPLRDSNGRLVHYIISVSGEWPQSLDGFIGSIKLFAGLFPPNGWQPCDGRVLTVPAQDTNLRRLATVLGSTYGGDGTNTTGLPLVGPVAGSIQFNGQSLPQSIICTRGPIATREDGNFSAGRVEEYVGEVGAFAGSYVPGDLAVTDGQTFNFNDAPALASVLDNGKTTSQLPNLAGLPAQNPANPSQVLKTMRYLIAKQGVYPTRS